MSEALTIERTLQGLRIPLRVMPRASRTAIEGIRGGRLLVRVTKAPVDDAANHAVVALIATALGLPRHAVQIVTGASSRNKTALITGLDEATIRARLSPNL
jgi:uncharacterized protein YggU (UPF0235/DUF167 family)